MGSTRQTFSEDRPGPGSLPARWTNTREIHLIIKSFWYDGIQNKQRRHLDILKIGQSWNLEICLKILHKIGLQNRCIGWNLLLLLELDGILLQLSLISLQQRLSVVVFQTNTVFFNLPKSYGILIMESLKVPDRLQQLTLVKSILSYYPVKETLTLSSFSLIIS